MRAWRRGLVIVILLNGLVASTIEADPIDELRNLECVAIAVENLPSAAIENKMTKGLFTDLLMVALKSKLPRLRISKDCAAYIYLNVNVINFRIGEEKRGITASTDLEVLRRAYIKAADASAEARVWDKGFLVNGEPADVRKAIREQIESYITSFAADYYEAENK